MRISPVLALSAVTGVKPATIRQWITRGQLRRLPDGSFDRDDLERLIDTRKIPA